MPWLAVSSVFIEELIVEVVILPWSQAKVQFLEHCDQFVSIDQLDGSRAVTDCLALCVCSESPRREDDALVCTPLERAAEITHSGNGHSAPIPLALKEYLEGNKRVDLQYAVTIDPAVT